MKPRTATLPIICPACRSKIQVPIVKLKQGSVIKFGCGKAIKTTADFLAVVRTME
jgi:hypothetical protein